MKIKIFKCIMNGENAVECSLHPSYEKAVFAAGQFIQAFNNDEAVMIWEDTEIETEENLGRNDADWDDTDWGQFFALYIERIQNSEIMGVNTVTIEEETIEIPDVKPMHGFTGDRIGAIDVAPGKLSEKALAVIRNFAWKCTDEGEDDFNMYCCTDFWENVPDEYEISTAVQAEINRFLAFMSANECWWARFIEW